MFSTVLKREMEPSLQAHTWSGDLGIFVAYTPFGDLDVPNWGWETSCRRNNTVGLRMDPYLNPKRLQNENSVDSGYQVAELYEGSTFTLFREISEGLYWRLKTWIKI